MLIAGNTRNPNRQNYLFTTTEIKPFGLKSFFDEHSFDKTKGTLEFFEDDLNYDEATGEDK